MLLIAAFVIAWGLVGDWIPTPWLPTAFEEATRGAFVNRDGRMTFRDGFDLRAFLALPGGSPAALVEVQSQARRLHVAAAAVPAFLLLAWATYRLIPAWTVRRARSRALDRLAAPHLASELSELARLAGLDEAAIDWHTRPGFLDGLACGASSRPRVIVAGDPGRLDNGLGDGHRAVVLHELGHVANRDAEARERARSAWLVLALFAAATPLVVLAQGGPWGRLAAVAGRLAGCGALALGLWAGLVRAREHLADWQVVRWGFGEALTRLLRLPETHIAPGARSCVARLRRALATHPTHADRLSILAEPARLFRVSPLLAFTTGALLALTVGHLGLVVVHLVVVAFAPVVVVLLTGGGVSEALFTPAAILLAGCLLVPLLHGVARALGVQVLRAALGDIATGSSWRWGYRRLFWIALAFVGGFELGLSLTPLGAVGRFSIPVLAVWLIVFGALVWLWLIQVRALGRLVLAAACEGAEAKQLERRLAVVAIVLLVPVIAPCVLIRAILAVAAALARGGEVTIFGLEQDTLAMIGVDWCVDLISIAIAGAALLGLTALVAAGIFLLRRRITCGRCGERSCSLSAVGVCCSRCGAPAAAWLYVRRPRRDEPAAEAV